MKLINYNISMTIHKSYKKYHKCQSWMLNFDKLLKISKCLVANNPVRSKSSYLNNKNTPALHDHQIKLSNFIKQKSHHFYLSYFRLATKASNTGAIILMSDYYDIIKKSYNWNELIDTNENVDVLTSHIDNGNTLIPPKYITQIFHDLVASDHSNAPIECGLSLFTFIRDEAVKLGKDLSFPIHFLFLLLTWIGSAERWIHNYEVFVNDNITEHNLTNCTNLSSIFIHRLIYPYNILKRYENGCLEEYDEIMAYLTTAKMQMLLNHKVKALSDLLDTILIPALEALGPHYDVITCQRAIFALSRFGSTDKIKNCYKYIQAANLSGHCSGTDIGRIAGSAFKSSTPDGRLSGWDILKCGGRPPSSPIDLQSNLSKSLNPVIWSPLQGKIQTFHTFKEPLTIALLHENKMQNDVPREQRGLNVLNYMASDDFPTHSYNVYPSIQFANLLKDYFENLPQPKWHGNFTKMTNNGRCQHCQTFLKPLTISHDDFCQMKESFFRVVIKGNDVFMKTTPKELNEFLGFIDSHKFDVVIDALNVCLGQAPSNASRFRILANVIEYFTIHRNQRVVVFGRKHMINWNKREADKVFRSCPTFLMDNVSKDDPFFIYAAMHAGLGTMILTKDMFRDHKFLLGQHGPTFDIWRKMHQLYLLKVKLDGTVNILPNLKHDIVAQSQDQFNWHIPYESGVPLKIYENLNTWLCLQKEVTSR